MTTTIKRACDACHRRKVKCDGISPCRNCSASQLSCTYNAIPQKKGPKGSRAKVISELRETQRQSNMLANTQSRMVGVSCQPPSPPSTPTPGLLNSDTVKDSVDFFFANMYPMMPILSRQRLEQQAMYMESSLDTYCLLTSLCAFTYLQPGMNLSGSNGDPYGMDVMPGANIVSATLLLEETLRLRKSYDYLESPTHNSLCTSYLLFACYYGLDMHEKAWFYLREATTLMFMTGMNKEDTYQQYDHVEASRRRRLFWLLYVTERACALQRQRPITLQATINLPTIAEDPTDPLAHQINLFLLQVSLFRPFEDALLGLWTKARAECPQSHLASLQKLLQELLPPYLNDTEAQLSELPINQQWLKNMSWQTSIANEHGTETSGSYPSPFDLANDLLPLLANFPSANLGMQGLELVEKLCSVVLLLTEFMSLQPPSRDPFTLGPRQHLHQILNIVTLLRNGDFRWLPLLLAKATEVLPKLASPMLQNAPETNSLCNIDIFDDFGNVGLAQPPCVLPEKFDAKFALTRTDDHISTDSGSSYGGSGGAPNDVNSPFASSPATLSPGLEMPHAMSSEYGSMSELVISPMSHGPPASSLNIPTSHHQQHQTAQHSAQQHVLPTYQGLNVQLQGLDSSLNQPPNLHMGSGMNMSMENGLTLSVGHNGNGLCSQQTQNSNNFAMPMLIRNVGTFLSLQHDTDVSGIGNMSMSAGEPEIDFGALAR